MFDLQIFPTNYSSSFHGFLLFLIMLGVCVYMRMCGYECRSQRTPEVGVTDSCEPPDIVLGIESGPLE